MPKILTVFDVTINFFHNIVYGLIFHLTLKFDAEVDKIVKHFVQILG